MREKGAHASRELVRNCVSRQLVMAGLWIIMHKTHGGGDGEADALQLMLHDRHNKYIPRKSLLGILTSSSLMSVATDKKYI